MTAEDTGQDQDVQKAQEGGLCPKQGKGNGEVEYFIQTYDVGLCARLFVLFITKINFACFLHTLQPNAFTHAVIVIVVYHCLPHFSCLDLN